MRGTALGVATSSCADGCRAHIRTYNQIIPDSRCPACNRASTYTRTGMLQVTSPCGQPPYLSRYIQEQAQRVPGSGLSITGQASELHPQARMNDDEAEEDVPELAY